MMYPLKLTTPPVPTARLAWTKDTYGTLTFDTDHYELANTAAQHGIASTGLSFTTGREYLVRYAVKNGTAPNGTTVRVMLHSGGLDGAIRCNNNQLMGYTLHNHHHCHKRRWEPRSYSLYPYGRNGRFRSGQYRSGRDIV